MIGNQIITNGLTKRTLQLKKYYYSVDQATSKTSNNELLMEVKWYRLFTGECCHVLAAKINLGMAKKRLHVI